jgi:hypothetical protein
MARTARRRRPAPFMKNAVVGCEPLFQNADTCSLVRVGAPRRCAKWRRTSRSEADIGRHRRGMHR